MTDRILLDPASRPDPKSAPAGEPFARAWLAGFIAIAAAFAWPFVRHFPHAQVSVLAQSIADSCLLEYVLARVSATGEWFLDWKLTQAPYVFPDYPLVSGLASVLGYGSASAAYPLLFCVLAAIGWGWFFAKARAAAPAIGFMIAIVFGMLWFDNVRGSPAKTYVYLFLPGHHAAFTLLAPAVFAATARCLDPRRGPWVAASLGTLSLLSGLSIMGDPLATFMFVLPAGVLAVAMATTGGIGWQRAGLILAACAAAVVIGQVYQWLALYPTGKQYTKELLAPMLSSPGSALAEAMKSSVPTFLADLRSYYFNLRQTGIWFLLPIAGWLLAVAAVVRGLRRSHDTTGDEEPTAAADRLLLVPATSLAIGLPLTVLLQVLLVGYVGVARSRQFVAFLFLGILVLLLIAGRAAARLRDRDPRTRSLIDLASAAVLGLTVVGFLLRTTPESATKRTLWHAIEERADAVHALAREAGVKRLMMQYWLAPPLALRHPDLEVDFHIGDLLYLEPRVRDPAVYRDGAIEAYVVEPLGLTETRLVELFGEPERSFSRETASGETVKLLVFPGDKPRTYNQWVTSYSPAIHGDRVTFPAATLAHFQPPQHGDSSYRLAADASATTIRAVHSFVSLWPGSCDYVFRFSGATKPKAVRVTLLSKGNKLLDAREVPVDAATGEATVEISCPTGTDPQVFGELIVDVPFDPRPAEGDAFIFEGLTIVRR